MKLAMVFPGGIGGLPWVMASIPRRSAFGQVCLDTAPPEVDGETRRFAIVGTRLARRWS